MLCDPSIPPGILSKLAEAGIETMGQLAARNLADSGADRITGIGPAALGKIAAATDAFWARCPEGKAPEVVPPEGPPDVDTGDGDRFHDPDA